MPSNKKSLSFFSLWLFIILCFASIMTALFIAISFSSALDEDKFTIEGIGIAKYDSTADEFSIIPLKNNAITNEKQKQFFTKNFLKEYVTTRYTVSGDSLDMQQNLGYQTPNTLNGGLILKIPSYIQTSDDGKILWTNAYNDFLNNDLPEIKSLLNSNTTRSVRILSGPQKVNDWWVLTVEFIYRNPTTYALSIAKKEKYEIRINMKSKGIRPTENINGIPAGNVFITSIMDIQKINL